MRAGLLILSIIMAASASALAQEEPGEDAADNVPAVTPPLELIEEDIQADALRDLETEETADTTEALPPPSEPSSEMDEIFGEAQYAYATEDYGVALLRAQTAAAGGHPQAATLVGILHVEGRAPRASDDTALTYFQRAAAQNEPVALYQIGLLARAGRAGLTPGTAGGYFQRAARGGHVPAMLAYALSLKATDVPQNAGEAMDWAERAAAHGNVEAMYQRALMASDWHHGPQDPVDARQWFERAATSGHAEAALQAGLMAATGEGGEEDPVAALAMIRRSAESGYAPAQGQYGLMLYQGWNGAEPDLTNAAHWFAEGADGDDAESEFLYAYVLARGEGVTQDLQAAYLWVVRAATDFEGNPVDNPQRDELQSRLESVLPGDVTARLRREALSDAAG